MACKRWGLTPLDLIALGIRRLTLQAARASVIALYGERDSDEAVCNRLLVGRGATERETATAYYLAFGNWDEVARRMK